MAFSVFVLSHNSYIYPLETKYLYLESILLTTVILNILVSVFRRNRYILLIHR